MKRLEMLKPFLPVIELLRVNRFILASVYS